MADAKSFEARLRTEGYPEIRTNQLEPNRHNAEHSHPFDVLALVLEGEITLTTRGKRADATALATNFRWKRDAGTSRMWVLRACATCVGRRPR